MMPNVKLRGCRAFAAVPLECRVREIGLSLCNNNLVAILPFDLVNNFGHDDMSCFTR